MYLGRFLVVGPNAAAYRVSSRSFPNRKVTERDRTLTVVPTADAAETENPYVSYNCLRIVEPRYAGGGSGGEGDGPAEAAIVGNGSHVDAIAEKIALGFPARDALALGLLTFDFEKDAYDTPRIAGVLDSRDSESTVGIVRRDALYVERVAEPTLLGTYERNTPELCDIEFGGAADAARTVYELDFEHPVCAAGVARVPGGGFEVAVENGPRKE